MQCWLAYSMIRLAWHRSIGRPEWHCSIGRLAWHCSIGRLERADLVVPKAVLAAGFTS